MPGNGVEGVWEEEACGAAGEEEGGEEPAEGSVVDDEDSGYESGESEPRRWYWCGRGFEGL